jgi:4-phytase / acid phosphatase
VAFAGLRTASNRGAYDPQTGATGLIPRRSVIFEHFTRKPKMRTILSRMAAVCLLIATLTALAQAQKSAATTAETGDSLQFVLILSRHGVRSPTGKAEQYNPYSAAPWPQWSVPPGYLTAHGYTLMTQFGAYDRARLASEGLMAPSGCADAAHVTILADSDERTRETGKAIAQGMFPGCAMDVQARPEGTPDPLFHSQHAGVENTNRALAQAAVLGRIGGDPNNLTEAYRPQLSALDRILAGCGAGRDAEQKRTSLFAIPTSDPAAKGERAGALRGPLTVASTLAENLLLEYTEGLQGKDLAWGCMDEAALRHVLQLHAASSDFTRRTPTIARMQSSNLLAHIVFSLEQGASGKPVQGALGKAGDRVLFLAGHDTNIETVAGTLGLTWIIDGRRDDTPPGGALVFELWRTVKGTQTVRVYYTAQTLSQMRTAQPLTIDHPPAVAPVFVPGCSRQDQFCTLDGFVATVNRFIVGSYLP